MTPIELLLKTFLPLTQAEKLVYLLNSDRSTYRPSTRPPTGQREKREEWEIFFVWKEEEALYGHNLKPSTHTAIKHLKKRIKTPDIEKAFHNKLWVIITCFIHVWVFLFITLLDFIMWIETFNLEVTFQMRLKRKLWSAWKYFFELILLHDADA
jgi:hypothetical protein